MLSTTMSPTPQPVQIEATETAVLPVLQKAFFKLPTMVGTKSGHESLHQASTKLLTLQGKEHTSGDSLFSVVLFYLTFVQTSQNKTLARPTPISCAGQAGRVQSEGDPSSLSAKMLVLSGSWSCSPFSTFSFSTSILKEFYSMWEIGEQKAGGLTLSSGFKGL